MSVNRIVVMNTLKNLLMQFLSSGVIAVTAAQLGVAEVQSSAIEVRVVSVPDGVSVAVGGGDLIRLSDLPSGVVIKDVLIHREEKALRVWGAKQPVIVTVTGFSGLSVRLAAGNELICQVNSEMGWVDFRCTSNNQAVANLFFHDGAKAEMGPASSARYDLFKDQSYYLSGRGRVTAVDADGLKRELSQFLPPMSGGPLVKVAEGKKGERLKRLIPLTEVALGGKYGEPMQIFVGPQKILLQPTSPQTVSLPNGTRITFSQDPKTQVLEWQVEKGFCRFWVSGFDCWSAFAVSEQSAGHAWDTSQGAVDLANRTPTNSPPPVREVLVRIANKFSASVPGITTFQYINVHNCTTYVGASDGNVEIFNPDTKQLTLVAGGLKTFRGGVAATTLNAPINAVAMNWEEGNALQVSGTPGDFKVAPKSRQTLRGENASMMDVDYGASGQIDITAISSAYTLTLAPLKDWKIGLGEGDGLSVQYDWKSGVFIGTAHPGNSGPVGFSSAEGYVPNVLPGGVITILGGNFGSLLSRMQGSVVFYEGGGAGGGSGFGASFGDNFLVPTLTPGLGNPDPRDSTRIPQPGASVVGK